MDKEKYKISFIIKDFNNFLFNIELIKLIDQHIIINNDNILNTKNVVSWILTTNSNYDYICEIDSKCDKEQFYTHLKYRFLFVQNFIKNKYLKFGKDWYIKYSVNKLF